MADQADLASRNDFTEEVLLRHRNAPPFKAAAHGRCLNCDAQVANLYCDIDCREDYEYQQRITKKVGR
jgi:hypothetical protein